MSHEDTILLVNTIKDMGAALSLLFTIYIFIRIFKK